MESNKGYFYRKVNIIPPTQKGEDYTFNRDKIPCVRGQNSLLVTCGNFINEETRTFINKQKSENFRMILYKRINLKI